MGRGKTTLDGTVGPGMSSGPNPITVGLSVFRSLLSVRRPGPFGVETVDHSHLSPALEQLDREGPGVLSGLADELGSYLRSMERIDPDMLSRHEALAFWINLYNAGALILAGQAQRDGVESVLGVPGGFRQRFVQISGEDLSLDDIEHGKLRRFGDPRIHAALVCGSVSCPTLRGEPYTGDRLNDQFDDQLRHFLAAGALQTDSSRAVVYLSRVFLWFGADFVRPHRMPAFIPARKSQILGALTPWIDPSTRKWIETVEPGVEFQRYDWGLSCAVR